MPTPLPPNGETSPSNQYLSNPRVLNLMNNHAHRWDSSGAMLEPLAATKPLMVGPGNHEIEYYANTEASFQVRWHLDASLEVSQPEARR